jgi:hypothetical protein
MSLFTSPDTLAHLRRLRQDAHRAYLDLCVAVGRAAVHEPGAVPELLSALQARYDERVGLDLLLASYDPQQGLYDDWTG